MVEPAELKNECFYSGFPEWVRDKYAVHGDMVAGLVGSELASFENARIVSRKLIRKFIL